MAPPNYWLDLFTGKTWQEFLDAGGEVTGFREGRRPYVQQFRPGDHLLCYLTGVSRWIGVLEVVSSPFRDTARIWSDEEFPWRVRVGSVVTLTPETGVPVLDLRERLSIFRDLKNPHAWTGHFRGSPSRWDADDAKVVVRAIEEAAANPIIRPVDPRKLARRPKAVKTSIGPATIPERDEQAEGQDAPPPVRTAAESEPTSHTEIQWLLLRLGAAMGLDVWVARNDRGRAWQNQSFANIPRLRRQLPRQFDDATNRTIELIDVLWLRGNAVVAAFEIEHTTSIYSGLLRMSDLIAMQPNLNIQLYLVAPDERRQKVFEEINRPTFGHLSPPLEQVCRYIGFSTLREELQRVGDLMEHLKLSFLDRISEPCTPEEA